MNSQHIHQQGLSSISCQPCESVLLHCKENNIQSWHKALSIDDSSTVFVQRKEGSAGVFLKSVQSLASTSATGRDLEKAYEQFKSDTDHPMRQNLAAWDALFTSNDLGTAWLFASLNDLKSETLKRVVNRLSASLNTEVEKVESAIQALQGMTGLPFDATKFGGTELGGVAEMNDILHKGQALEGVLEVMSHPCPSSTENQSKEYEDLLDDLQSFIELQRERLQRLDWVFEDDRVV